MNIEVNSTTILKQIQEEFNKTYPFLWIEFMHSNYTDKLKYDKMKPETILNDFGSFDGTKEINIDGTNTVAQVENAFSQTLNLTTKVMRKSGNTWVRTSFTSNWTLDNQNYEGGQIVL